MLLCWKSAWRFARGNRRDARSGRGWLKSENTGSKIEVLTSGAGFLLRVRFGEWLCRRKASARRYGNNGECYRNRRPNCPTLHAPYLSEILHRATDAAEADCYESGRP